MNKQPSSGWWRFLVLVTAVSNFFAGVILAQGRRDVFVAILAMLFLIWILVLVFQLGGRARTE
jgi:hypothetical protein